jgi:hypothetical protein
MKTTGLIKFHFWGNYAETCAIGLLSKEDAEKLAQKMNEIAPLSAKVPSASGGFSSAQPWSWFEKDGKFVVTARYGQDDCEKVKKALESLGAKNPTSMKTSIDHGLVFTIELK